MGTSTSITAGPGLTGDVTRDRAQRPGGKARVGMSRGDLKELGELLDKGDSGLLIVAAQDTEARIDEALKHGNKIVKKQLRSDEKDLEAAIDEALKESKS